MLRHFLKQKQVKRRVARNEAIRDSIGLGGERTDRNMGGWFESFRCRGGSYIVVVRVEDKIQTKQKNDDLNVCLNIFREQYMLTS